MYHCTFKKAVQQIAQRQLQCKLCKCVNVTRTALTHKAGAGLGELRSRLHGPQATTFLAVFLERSPEGAELQALWAAQAVVRPAHLPMACLSVCGLSGGCECPSTCSKATTGLTCAAPLHACLLEYACLLEHACLLEQASKRGGVGTGEAHSALGKL